MQASLGETLRQLREQHKLSLRDLEGRTGLSNGYLSLLENEKVKQPKPPVLYKLAGALSVPYPELMRLAGYLPADDQQSSTAQSSPMIMFKGAEQLDPEQRERVQEYIDFVLTKPRSRGPGDDDTR